MADKHSYKHPSMYSYTLSSYLADRWWALLVGALVLAALWLVGSVLAVSASGVAIMLALTFCGGIVLLAIGYLRRRRYYRELKEISQNVSLNAHALALLPDPDFLEGRVTSEALEDLIRREEAEENKLHQAFDDYRAYVEAWVHEVKTPLAAAQLIAARIGTSQDADGFNLARELDRIESQVQSVLFYARTSTMAHDYLLREVSLARVVREACRKNARLLIERGCTPNIDIDESLCIITDRNWLGFMLGQLIVNAAKYGAKTICFSVSERTEGTSSGHTTLKIVDDGWGISAADAPRVFDRGFTGENGRKVGQATGMGLYLVATMAEAMGIGVGLSSEIGSGTSIYLRFPHSFIS